MEQQDWQKIERILDEVLAIENPIYKREVIKEACKNNQQLYDEVVHIIANIEEAEEKGFLEFGNK